MRMGGLNKMNWKRTKTLFIFVFILVNILLVLIYVNKVTKSQINESESDNEVKFGKIKISKDILNKDVSGTKMQMITAKSKDFESYAKGKSSLETEDSGNTLTGEINSTVNVSDSFK